MQFILLSISILFLTTSSYKWNESGHRVIAISAYNKMSKELRKNILDILKTHPFYKQDFVDPIPKELNSEEDIAKWQFSQIAVWPDLIRDKKHPGNEEFHKWQWHFINLSVFPNQEIKDFFKDGTSANTALVYDSIKTKDEMNIMQVLDYIQKNFSSVENSLPKAVQLCWAFHLVGDLHQPLHSSALYTKEIFKDGDRGGNSILGEKYNLHSIWDWAIVDNGIDWLVLEKKSEEIDQIKYNANKKTNSMDWLNESHDLAKHYVYTEEIKESVLKSEKEKPEEKKVKVELSKNYKSEMKEQAAIASQKASLRLAEFLAVIL
jgi:hypothetical protein